MSIKSMTGQGRAELAAGGIKIAVELRAVNHRQFEARLDLPPALTAIENDVRARLHERIARGYVTCRVQLDVSAAIRQEAVCVDYDLAAALVGRLRQAGKKQVQVFPRREMVELVVVDGAARGIVARNLVNGAIESYVADAVIVATGGYGNVFFLSTNAMMCNATATWRAYKRGALFGNP